MLYIFWFLHQTTTHSLLRFFVPCCISFDSYIKPQLQESEVGFSMVVYLLIPTSNHNTTCQQCYHDALYIFWFLHQTTTQRLPLLRKSRCISFDSYIKPQHHSYSSKFLKVVYLLIPTSNHNFYSFFYLIIQLYIFWFLHQTTTDRN